MLVQCDYNRPGFTYGPTTVGVPSSVACRSYLNFPKVWLGPDDHRHRQPPRRHRAGLLGSRALGGPQNISTPKHPSFFCQSPYAGIRRRKSVTLVLYGSFGALRNWLLGLSSLGSPPTLSAELNFHSVGTLRLIRCMHFTVPLISQPEWVACARYQI